MRAPNESLGGDVFPKSVCTERMPLLKGEVPAAQAEGFESADFGRFNLWRPIVVDRTRGSPSRQRRLTIRKEACGFAEFGKLNLWFPNSSPEPAAASGCRLSLPQLLRGTASDSLQTKNPEASIYGRRIRLGFGGSKWLSALPTGSKWVQALPARRAAS